MLSSVAMTSAVALPFGSPSSNMLEVCLLPTLAQCKCSVVVPPERNRAVCGTSMK